MSDNRAFLRLAAHLQELLRRPEEGSSVVPEKFLSDTLLEHMREVLKTDNTLQRMLVHPEDYKEFPKSDDPTHPPYLHGTPITVTTEVKRGEALIVTGGGQRLLFPLLCPAPANPQPAAIESKTLWDHLQEEEENA